jgi:hypothetical protein
MDNNICITVPSSQTFKIQWLFNDDVMICVTIWWWRTLRDVLDTVYECIASSLTAFRNFFFFVLTFALYIFLVTIKWMSWSDIWPVACFRCTLHSYYIATRVIGSWTEAEITVMKLYFRPTPAGVIVSSHNEQAFRPTLRPRQSAWGALQTAQLCAPT